MPKDGKKPKWKRPKLVVLVKGSNQEAVLTNCKAFGVSAVAAATVDADCLVPYPCMGCQETCAFS
jgi:hypothetical protein